MNKKHLMIPAILAAAMSVNATAEVIDTTAPPAEPLQAVTPAPSEGVTQTEMLQHMQQMQKMRQQHMEMMQANQQGMPMMGPRGGMMDPQMQQQMQEMRQQRMEMMQAGPQGMNEPQADADPGQKGGYGMSCAERHAKGGMKMKGMKKEMMAKKRQHMQTMEQRLANIEELMRELVELQKAK